MATIKNKNTTLEVRVRKALFRKGFRYKINERKLPGSPDIVLPKYRSVIFIHGCFWHGHSCNSGKAPATNTEFWKEKMNSNKKRDKQAIGNLKKLKWRVIVIWQCEIKNKFLFETRVDKLVDEILKGSISP